MYQSKLIPNFFGSLTIDNLVKNWFVYQLDENRKSLLIAFLEIKNRVLNNITLFWRQSLIKIRGVCFREKRATKLDFWNRCGRLQRRENRHGFYSIDNSQKTPAIKKRLRLEFPQVIFLAIIFLQVAKFFEVTHCEHNRMKKNFSRLSGFLKDCL